MKKLTKVLVASALALASVSLASAKSKKAITIAIPNDTTNEARALLLLEDNGYIKLREGAGITATPVDIVENPYNLKFKEIEAAQVPNVRRDVDYAIINSNYAMGAGLNPNDALLQEGSSSAYVNVLVVKQGNESKPELKALSAALNSTQVKDYIAKTYGGAVVSVADNPTDGYDPSIDYTALKGAKVTVAATPTPHAEILQIAKEILGARDITLEVLEFNDYVQPNNLVESGDVDANYFQHLPYLEDFNKENGTHLVSIAGIHVEPMGLYAGKKKNLSAITK